MEAEMSIVRVNGLRKSYPSFELDNVSFSLEEGRITGFIGINGAGKTKTIKAGSKIGTLPTPKRKGYTFTGWYTQKTKGKKASGNTKLSKNTVLYAHWLKGPVPKTGISKLTAGKQKITVGIKKVKNVKGYQVRYALKSNMQSAKSVSSKNTTITLKKLKKGKKYYIQVRTYRLDTSGDKVYGSWSSKKSIKSK